jgi:hypothetical protein
MISFSNPLMLWSLLGLSIPLAIHLLSRKEGKVIMIGSVRHLEESPSQQFKGIKLNEFWLLLLRSLLIIVLSFFLAGAHYTPESSHNKKWLIIEKALLEKTAVKNLIDSFSTDGYEIRFLAKDFPLLETNEKIIPSDYYSLLEALENQNISKGIVISSNTASLFDGDAVSLPSNIQWLSIATDPTSYLVSSRSINSDSLMLRYGYSDADLTYFNNKLIHKNDYKDSLAITNPDTLKISIYAETNFQYDKQIIEAALTVIQKSFRIPITKQNIIDKSDYKNNGWLIWLSNETAPICDCNIIYFKEQDYTGLIKKVSAYQWALTQRLNQEVATQQHLTLDLASLFINTEALRKRALAFDARFLSDSLAFAFPANEKVAAISPVSYESLSDILLMLFIGLFVIERLLSYIRKQ